MVIDTSAIVAILQDEPERRTFNRLIASAAQRWLSAASLVELSIVMEVRYGVEGQSDLDLFIRTAAIEIIALNPEQAEIARSGFTRFGKGRHQAGLNLGDCFSYALAKWSDSALLFKGNDFLFTDVKPADTSLH